MLCASLAWLVHCETVEEIVYLQSQHQVRVEKSLDALRGSSPMLLVG